MKQAVLLLAHGAPESIDDIAEYLTYVRNGRPTAPEIVEEVRHRYAAIGGGSPLLARTREQALALEKRLAAEGPNAHVYFAMRNWRPFIKDVVAGMQADGIERVAAICLAPQYSKASVGLYFRRVQEAKQAAGFQAEILWAKTFHDHPRLIDAFAERLAPLLPAERVLFTAHSLPVRVLAGADPYDAEAKATAALVAARAGIERWDFAYQSQGMTDEEWLGPTVESTIDRYAAEDVRRVALAPIGFVSDHVEIAYDVDRAFREYAGERGIALERPASLNDSPAFVDALADVARRRLCAP